MIGASPAVLGYVAGRACVQFRNHRWQAGGLVTFNRGPAQLIIALATTKVIANGTQLDGGGLISLDMAENDRHFYVAPVATLQLDQIRLTEATLRVMAA